MLGIKRNECRSKATTHPSSLLVKLADISALERPREKSEEMMGDEGPQLDATLTLLAILDWPLQPECHEDGWREEERTQITESWFLLTEDWGQY